MQLPTLRPSDVITIETHHRGTFDAVVDKVFPAVLHVLVVGEIEPRVLLAEEVRNIHVRSGIMTRDDFLGLLALPLKGPARRLYDWLLEHPEELALPLNLALARARWAAVVGLPLETPGWEQAMSWVAGGVAVELMARTRT